MLSILQTILALVFGGFGLWQRNQILADSWGGWASTDRLHVWPWAFKFAVISNMPAFVVGVVLDGLIRKPLPTDSEAVQLVKCLLFVPILWYWVGSSLDHQRARVVGKVSMQRQMRLIACFTALCAAGASIPIGYIGFVPYGILVWVGMTSALWRLSVVPSETRNDRLN